MSGFLIPEAVDKRPAYVPISIEWPHDVIATLSERRKVSHAGTEWPLIDAELRLTGHSNAGPLRFEVVTSSWRLEYEMQFRPEQVPSIVPCSSDGLVVTPHGEESLAAFLTRVGVHIGFEQEVVLLPQGLLLRPEMERRLFPAEAIGKFDWSGIDIRRESQGPDRDPTTIQARAILALASEAEWDVVVDDDGPGELADIVLLKRTDSILEAVFVHCKYSTSSTPGARIGDMYDVCGQAIKMNRSKTMPQLLMDRLLRREKARKKMGLSGMMVGDERDLAKLVDAAPFCKIDATVIIVQPGLSRALISEDIRTLLGGTERYLLDTHQMKLRVIGNE